MNRRGFLAGILAAGISPWVMSGGVASGILMPVRKLWAPTMNLYDPRELLKLHRSITGGILSVYAGTPPPNPNDPPTGGLIMQFAT